MEYIVREPRPGAECPQGNQKIAIPPVGSTTGNNMIPETFYTPYGSEFRNVQQNRYLPYQGNRTNTQQTQSRGGGAMMQGSGNSGIDITYLAGYSSNKAHYIATGPTESPRHTPPPPRTLVVPAMTTTNSDTQNTMSRFEKIKMVQKNGPRAFTGPVDKVLKWHKALQDIGVLIIYEIIAKCVSVQPGKSCSKNLVLRDDIGPAMQVVYYEIDFLLPELKPPCTVRVVGRMMPGTCRLQAFTVRPATGDDVATLPRRAAVASHHVTKMCKEFGPNVDKV